MSQRRSSQKHSSQRNRPNSQRNLSQSENNFSQKARADDLTEEQFEGAVLNVTKFLLSDMRSKRKIKKDEIVTYALNKSARQYAAIMQRVENTFSNMFGLQIVNIPNNNDAYIIVNKCREKFIELTEEISTEEMAQDDLVLTVVLSTIFMNRGQMYQSHVMAVLETIGFLKERFFHSSSSQRSKADVFKLVKNVFVKQQYLDAMIVPRPEQVQVPPLPPEENKVTVLQWGIRAYLEADVDKIVDYLVKMFNGRKPSGFPSTYYMELKAKQSDLRAQARLN